MAESSPAAEQVYKNQRSQRLHMAVSVSVNGTCDGKPFEETSKTEVISSKGCLIVLAAPVVKGQKLQIVNQTTLAEAPCTVVTLQRESSGMMKAGLSFEKSVPRFWGVYFPPEDWNPADRKRPEPKRRQE
jgi:hypothetical protein